MRSRAADELLEVFLIWLARAENQTGRKLKTFRGDREGAFTGKAFLKELAGRGVLWQCSASKQSEQNGKAERMIRTLSEATRTMVASAGLDQSYWDLALLYVVWCRNRLINSTNKEATPHELFTGEKPDLSLARTWGCMALIYIPDKERPKYAMHAKYGVFVGCSEASKAWEFIACLEYPGWAPPDARQMRTTGATASFLEHMTYPQWLQINHSDPTLLIKMRTQVQEKGRTEERPLSGSDDEAEDAEPRPAPSSGEQGSRGSRFRNLLESQGLSQTAMPCQEETKGPHTPKRVHWDPELDSATGVAFDVDDNGEPLGYMKGGAPGPMCMLTNEGIPGEAACIELITPSLQALVAALAPDADPIKEPKTIQEALAGPFASEWKEAIFKELDTLVDRDTYVLERLPPGKSAIGVKWIFKVKLKGDGSIERFKARMVVRGFTQIKGEDYNETYAPVSRFTTFRVMMAIKAVQGLHIKQLDVGNAFLYGKMAEHVLYMKQPPGLEDGTGRVCRLLKSLYGLKQAPKIWYEKLGSTLVRAGFCRSQNDWALYLKDETTGVVWILLYVDDILILGYEAGVAAAAAVLRDAYTVKEEDGSKYLGVNEEHTPDGDTYLSMRRYGQQLQDLWDLEAAPGATTPMSKEPIHPQPSRTQASDLAPARLNQKALTEYQRKVGKLMFAATTIRGDIQLAVGKLAQGSKGPNQIHLEQVDRGLKYLHSTASLSIAYSAAAPAATTLHGYCDADFSRNLYTTSVGADDEVVHCTTGYCFLFGGGLISWGSKKQSAPVLSSMEAELVAAVSAAQEAAYLRRLIEAMGVPQQRPTPIFTDSKSLVALMENQTRLQRSKHATRLHWLRHAQDTGIIRLVWIPRHYNAADYLTRVTTRKESEDQRQRCGMTKPGCARAHHMPPPGPMDFTTITKEDPNALYDFSP